MLDGVVCSLVSIRRPNAIGTEHDVPTASVWSIHTRTHNSPTTEKTDLMDGTKMAMPRKHGSRQIVSARWRRHENFASVTYGTYVTNLLRLWARAKIAALS